MGALMKEMKSGRKRSRDFFFFFFPPVLNNESKGVPIVVQRK